MRPIGDANGPHQFSNHTRRRFAAGARPCRSLQRGRPSPGRLEQPQMKIFQISRHTRRRFAERARPFRSLLRGRPCPGRPFPATARGWRGLEKISNRTRRRFAAGAAFLSSFFKPEAQHGLAAKTHVPGTDTQRTPEPAQFSGVTPEMPPCEGRGLEAQEMRLLRARHTPEAAR